MTAIHYSGGVTYVRGSRSVTYLPGWPACGNGAHAYRVQAAGAQTTDIGRVTCKRCLAAHAKQSDLRGTAGALEARVLREVADQLQARATSESIAAHRADVGLAKADRTLYAAGVLTEEAHRLRDEAARTEADVRGTAGAGKGEP